MAKTRTAITKIAKVIAKINIIEEKCQMGQKEGIRNIEIAKALIQLTMVFLIVCTVIFVVGRLTKEPQPEISGTFISDKLEAASDLASAKMTYNGLIHYSDGDIPFLTLKAFSMTYRAKIKAGIDLSKVVVEITDSKVIITIPQIEVLDLSIDTDSIQYYDQKSALFNGESKEDALKAISAAKEDVTENGGIDELKMSAKSQIEVLMNSLFKDSIGDRALTLVFKK
ncbi:MAG: DUF4230 domain-containing protein [Clostridiaceae bacterium]|nr:DUF4230 domain-containing protein [Clostridiaceae bacterium]